METSTTAVKGGQTAKSLPVAREGAVVPALPGVAMNMLMIISLEGMGMFKCMLVGMEYGQYLIIKSPVMPDLPLKLYQQNYFVIRYLYGGSVFGFKTTLMSVVREPVRLFILEYPRTVESLNLRKSQRFVCQLPACARITLESAELVNINGFIIDVSSDGCCLECSNADEPESLNAKIGSSLMLEFRMDNDDTAYVLPVEVRVLKKDMKQTQYGLKYSPEPDNQTHQIAINVILAFIDRLKG